jgi:hypothetical protein
MQSEKQQPEPKPLFERTPPTCGKLSPKRAKLNSQAFAQNLFRRIPANVILLTNNPPGYRKKETTKPKTSDRSMLSSQLETTEARDRNPR